MTTKVIKITRENSKNPDFVYIGREFKKRGYNLETSIWQNPEPMKNRSKKEHERAKEAFRNYILKRPDLLARLPELRNKTLLCWCKPPIPCHGDVLVELLQEMEP